MAYSADSRKHGISFARPKSPNEMRWVSASPSVLDFAPVCTFLPSGPLHFYPSWCSVASPEVCPPDQEGWHNQAGSP